jgi:DNA mismatch repair ATPase MutS
MSSQQIRKYLDILTESTTVDEKVKSPYAVGMAVAKKKYGYGEKPAHDLPKKVISKAHEIAKKIDEEEISEKWDTETKVSPEERGKYKGKTKSELVKQYNQLKASGPHKKGSQEYGTMKELAFAIRAKSNWGKVKDE